MRSARKGEKHCVTPTQEAAGHVFGTRLWGQNLASLRFQSGHCDLGGEGWGHLMKTELDLLPFADFDPEGLRPE